MSREQWLRPTISDLPAIEFQADRTEILPIAVPDASTGEKPIPLDAMNGISDIGLDIEQTVYNENPAHLRLNTLHMMHWALSQKIEGAQQVDPNDYPKIASLPARERAEAIKALYAAVVAQVGDEVLVERALLDMTHLAHDDVIRTTSIQRALGVSDKEIWSFIKNYWKVLAPTYEERAAMTELTPVPGIVPFLNEMIARGKRIHFITNGGETRVRPTLDHVLNAGGFNGTYNFISAGDMGFTKPKPEAFRRAFEDAQLLPSDALKGRYPFMYIGNNVKDVIGPMGAGASHAVLLNQLGIDFSRYGLPAHYEVRDFRGLLKAMTPSQHTSE